MRWASIVCAERDWSDFNPSVNGLGFINNRQQFGEGDLPSTIIADQPNIVVVAMGLNDNLSYSSAADRIRSQIGEDFDRLEASLPDAQFIVVEPFWYTDVRPESVVIIVGWVSSEAGARGWGQISGVSHWIEAHPEWMSADGLHPNDEGHAQMAVRMDAALTALGL